MSCLIKPFDFVTGTNRPAFEDVRSKSTAMRQCLQDVFPGDALKIPTRLTQSISATDGITDTEPLADEMVERSVSGDDIPPMFARIEFDPPLAFNRVDGFLLDERQIVAIRAFFICLPLDEGSRFDLPEISITPKTTSSDGLDFTTFGHLDACVGSSEDALGSSYPIHTHRIPVQ
jgi:hypothetical protein